MDPLDNFFIIFKAGFIILKAGRKDSHPYNHLMSLNNQPF